MTLWGCTPWWAQLSVCLHIPIVSFRNAFETSGWFRETEKQCYDSCRVTNSPQLCMECWTDNLTKSESAFHLYCGIKEGLCENDSINPREAFINAASSCIRND